jgi:UDP-3-O-[3-hydroxymyristoyl] glucosamine N-acyltransferase
MTENREYDAREARKRLKQFLTGKTGERLFVQQIPHPSTPTGLCYCDNSVFRTIGMCFKAWLLETLLQLPFDGPKLWFLRRLGARIGKNVHIAAGAWIDPLYTQLLTIEDNVFIGMHTKIFMHEYRINEFRVGKITIRTGSFIGGSAIIGCGIEVGEGATVAAGTVLGCDVPPRSTIGGNPPRIIKRNERPSS